MFYRVEREPFCDHKPPCDEAKKMSVEWWDIRTCTEEWYNKHIGKYWRSSGKNHVRITKSHKISEKGSFIARQMDNMDVWVVEINSLEELNDFIAKYGDCVISKSNYGTINEWYNVISICSKQ